MKKQKVNYRFMKYKGQPLLAKREISYGIKLSSQLLLDELCFRWNKENLEATINHAIDTGNKQEFLRLSREYRTVYFRVIN